MLMGICNVNPSARCCIKRLYRVVGHRLQGGESRVGMFIQAGLPMPVPK